MVRHTLRHCRPRRHASDECLSSVKNPEGLGLSDLRPSEGEEDHIEVQRDDGNVRKPRDIIFAVRGLVQSDGDHAVDIVSADPRVTEASTHQLA